MPVQHETQSTTVQQSTLPKSSEYEDEPVW